MWINSKFALRVDDMGMHAVCCGMNMWTAKMGAPTVNINGKKAYRKDDMGQSCGGMTKLIEGSADVIVGDGAGGGSAPSTGAKAGSIAAGQAGSGNAANARGDGESGTSGDAGTYGDSGGDAGGGSGGGDSPQTTSAAAPAPGPEEQSDPNDKTHSIDITLNDPDGKPMSGVKIRVRAPDGRTIEKTLDASGNAKFEQLTEGTCEVSFPKLNENPRARS